jgi:hypothetical protein
MTAPYQVQAGCAVVTGPDGVHRVGIQIHTGPITVGLLVDADQADTFADALAADIKAKAADARRAGMGLLLPGVYTTPVPAQSTTGPLNVMLGPNGHTPG